MENHKMLKESPVMDGFYNNIFSMGIIPNMIYKKEYAFIHLNLICFGGKS